MEEATFFSQNKVGKKDAHLNGFNRVVSCPLRNFTESFNTLQRPSTSQQIATYFSHFMIK